MTLRAIELGLCTSALAAFSWGMACFFKTSSGPTRGTRMVAVCGLCSASADIWAIVTSSEAVWRALVAMALYVIAIGLFFWAVRTCRSQPLTAIFEADTPRHIVRSGPYRYMRHPFYTAYTLVWFAAWVASGRVVTLASAIVMTAIYLRAAALEQAKFRASPLARAYEAYSCR